MKFILEEIYYAGSCTFGEGGLPHHKGPISSDLEVEWYPLLDVE